MTNLFHVQLATLQRCEHPNDLYTWYNVEPPSLSFQIYCGQFVVSEIVILGIQHNHILIHKLAVLLPPRRARSVHQMQI